MSLLAAILWGLGAVFVRPLLLTTRWQRRHPVIAPLGTVLALAWPVSMPVLALVGTIIRRRRRRR